MTSSLAMLYRASRRRLLTHWIGPFLLIIGIALATAVLIAILYASYASVRSFQRSTSEISADNYAQVRSRSGEILDSAAVPWLRTLPPGVRIFAILRGASALIGEDSARVPVFVTGVGLVSDSLDTNSDRPRRDFGTIAISKSLAARLQLDGKLEAHFASPHGPKPLKLAIQPDDERFLAISDSTIFTDIPTAAGLTGKRGRVSELLFEFPDRQSKEVYLPLLKSAVDSVGEGSIYVESDSEHQETVGRMLAAFRGNILVMVAMTFLVCVFTIYNAARLNALSIEPEIRTLRTLGVSRLALFVRGLSEALVFGVVGAAIGLTLGQPLTSVLAKLFLRTARDLYLGDSVFPALNFSTGAGLYLMAFGAALLACVAGSILPAWRAAGLAGGFIRPESASPRKSRRKRSLLWSTIWGFGGSALALHARSSGRYGEAYLSCLFFIATLFSLSGPLAELWALPGMRRVFRLFRSAGLVSLSHVQFSARKSLAVVGVSASAAALLIALAVMVGSFRSALEEWTGYTFRADIFIRPAEKGDMFSPIYLDDDFVNKVGSLPAIAEIAAYSMVTEHLGSRLYSVAGADIEVGARHGIYRILSGALNLTELKAGNEVLVTESFSNNFGKKVGDLVELRGRAFRIQAVYEDFSSERGIILHDLSRFRALYNLRGTASLALYLKSDASPEQVRQEVFALGEGRALVTKNADLRVLVLKIFDETFRITTLMRVIVVFICGLGFLVSMVQLIHERRRELKTLFTLGMSVGQVRVSFLLEGLALAVSSSILGFVGGAVLALILINIINPLSFGWSFPVLFRLEYFLVPAAVIALSNCVGAFAPISFSGKLFRSARVNED